jgi:hypothetical protein
MVFRIEFDLMDKIFQRILDNNFSDFKGLTADLSIPVPESIINEFIEAALQRNKNIESCQMSIHGQNRVSVDLKTKALPWALNLKLKLDKAVDFASYSSPKIRAWLENNQLLGSLGSFFKVLPEGVKLYGNQVVIDLGVFLRTPEQKRLLDLIKSVDIKTEEGKIILEIEAEVN